MSSVLKKKIVTVGFVPSIAKKNYSSHNLVQFGINGINRNTFLFRNTTFHIYCEVVL